MTTTRIEMAIDRIQVGRTQVVYGHVVTKWSDNAVEIGTWGRSTLTVIQAAEQIAQEAH